MQTLNHSFNKKVIFIFTEGHLRAQAILVDDIMPLLSQDLFDCRRMQRHRNLGKVIDGLFLRMTLSEGESRRIFYDYYLFLELLRTVGWVTGVFPLSKHQNRLLPPERLFGLLKLNTFLAKERYQARQANEPTLLAQLTWRCIGEAERLLSELKPGVQDTETATEKWRRQPGIEVIPMEIGQKVTISYSVNPLLLVKNPDILLYYEFNAYILYLWEVLFGPELPEEHYRSTRPHFYWIANLVLRRLTVERIDFDSSGNLFGLLSNGDIIGVIPCKDGLAPHFVTSHTQRPRVRCPGVCLIGCSLHSVCGFRPDHYKINRCNKFHGFDQDCSCRRPVRK